MVLLMYCESPHEEPFLSSCLSSRPSREFIMSGAAGHRVTSLCFHLQSDRLLRLMYRELTVVASSCMDSFVSG